MKYLIITEADWQSLRDKVLNLAACCLKAFGEESKHADWLHNGDVCRLLGISKRTLQHPLDGGVAGGLTTLTPAGGAPATRWDTTQDE